MLNGFFDTFKILPKSNRAMVYLMWIYLTGVNITLVFINIYIYKVFGSLYDLIWYNLIFWVSNFLGGAIFGFLFSQFKKDVKYMYYISFVLSIGSFLVLFSLDDTVFGVYIFTILYSLGHGLFWNVVHTQELANIGDEDRDFYSSSIHAGGSIIKVVTPLLVSFIFYLGVVYSYDGYMVIFGFLPVVFLFSFLYIRHIKSYIPNPITKADIKNFFDMKKYKFGHFYYLTFTFGNSIEHAILPIIAIYLLITEINVGLYEGILAFLSAIIVVLLSNRRNINNRFKYFLVLSLGLFSAFVVFSCFFNFTVFIIFSLFLILIRPLHHVSSHTYSLRLMDSVKAKGSDFYPSLLFRGFFLVLGRIIGLSFMLLIISFLGLSMEQALRVGLFLVGIGFLFEIFLIYSWEKKEKIINTIG